MIKVTNKKIFTEYTELPVLSSSLAYLGVLHMLHSDRLAQFTFPHLYTHKKVEGNAG